MSAKPKILTFLSYYLPGYEAGGPIRTLANMVEHLDSDFEFYIVTRDRDINDAVCYPDIKKNQWQRVGNANVLYVSPDNQRIAYYKQLMLSDGYDMLYLNSFFDIGLTVKPLIAHRLLNSKNKLPLIVAPRGEFSFAALQLKSARKRTFIWAARAVGLYEDAIFQASSPYEAEDIKKAFGIPQTDIYIAVDLPVKTISAAMPGDRYSIDADRTTLQIIYLSRIAPMKNLTYALEILNKVRIPIKFDIYGPIPDEKYWSQCQALISKLPSNIAVEYLGSVSPQLVSNTFAAYDLLFLPTLGENYGHVIAECLAVGTRVLISDRTPWRNLERDGLGWDIALDQPEMFRERINALGSQAAAERNSIRSAVRNRAAERLLLPRALEANRRLFHNVARSEGS